MTTTQQAKAAALATLIISMMGPDDTATPSTDIDSILLPMLLAMPGQRIMKLRVELVDTKYKTSYLEYNNGEWGYRTDTIGQSLSGAVTSVSMTGHTLTLYGNFSSRYSFDKIQSADTITIELRKWSIDARGDVW